MVLIIFSDVVGDILGQAFGSLPMMVLFAKIIPKNIEATCFAFLTGTINLMSTLSGIIGAWINTTFVGVT